MSYLYGAAFKMPRLQVCSLDFIRHNANRVRLYRRKKVFLIFYNILENNNEDWDKYMYRKPLCSQ